MLSNRVWQPHLRLIPRLEAFAQIGSLVLSPSEQELAKRSVLERRSVRCKSSPFVTAPRLLVPVSFHSPANGGMVPNAGW